jgi:peptidyl-prolyl cis-trans isomerase C
LLAVFSSALAVSGCHFGGSQKPSGQVVATVGGREITRRELQAEMAGSTASTPAAQKAQQQAALERIIQRVILANAAKDQGLDKEPSFAILSQRANEALLVELLQNKVAASVPAPSSEEVTQFIQTNSNIFAERKLFDIDQIRAPRPSDPKIVKQLEPLKTLDEIAAFFTQSGMPFQRGTNVMDAVGQDPKLLNAILALPPREVFILSAGNEIFINQIRDTHVVPFVGEPAIKYAVSTLKAQHMREAVARRLNRVLAKERPSVRINEQLEPAKAPSQNPKPL